MTTTDNCVSQSNPITTLSPFQTRVKEECVCVCVCVCVCESACEREELLTSSFIDYIIGWGGGGGEKCFNMKEKNAKINIFTSFHVISLYCC